MNGFDPFVSDIKQTNVKTDDRTQRKEPLPVLSGGVSAHPSVPQLFVSVSDVALALAVKTSADEVGTLAAAPLNQRGNRPRCHSRLAAEADLDLA